MPPPPLLHPPLPLHLSSSAHHSPSTSPLPYTSPSTYTTPLHTPLPLDTPPRRLQPPHPTTPTTNLGNTTNTSNKGNKHGQRTWATSVTTATSMGNLHGQQALLSWQLYGSAGFDRQPWPEGIVLWGAVRSAPPYRCLARPPGGPWCLWGVVRGGGCLAVMSVSEHNHWLANPSPSPIIYINK